MSRLPNDTTFAKISTEGYCCMHGYLRLCKARGENVPDMAKWLGMHRFTLYYHYRRLKNNQHPCQKLSTCLMPIIEVIENDPDLLKEKGP